jgi:hypothetical protein
MDSYIAQVQNQTRPISISSQSEGTDQIENQQAHCRAQASVADNQIPTASDRNIVIRAFKYLADRIVAAVKFVWGKIFPSKLEADNEKQQQVIDTSSSQDVLENNAFTSEKLLDGRLSDDNARDSIRKFISEFEENGDIASNSCVSELITCNEKHLKVLFVDEVNKYYVKLSPADKFDKLFAMVRYTDDKLKNIPNSKSKENLLKLRGMIKTFVDTTC